MWFVRVDGFPKVAATNLRKDNTCRCNWRVQAVVNILLPRLGLFGGSVAAAPLGNAATAGRFAVDAEEPPGECSPPSPRLSSPRSPSNHKDSSRPLGSIMMDFGLLRGLLIWPALSFDSCCGCPGCERIRHGSK